MEKIIKSIEQGKMIDSRDIAEELKTPHARVLTKINKLRKELKEIDGEENNQRLEIFKKRTRKYRGRTFHYFEMNKPAFTLLMMTFSGKKALEWQNAFLDSFFEMEKKLSEKMPLNWNEE